MSTCIIIITLSMSNNTVDPNKEEVTLKGKDQQISRLKSRGQQTKATELDSIRKDYTRQSKMFIFDQLTPSLFVLI